MASPLARGGELGCSQAVGAGDPCSRGMAGLVRREGEGTSGVMSSPPSTALALRLGSAHDHPYGTDSALPAFWGLGVQVKTEKNQVRFESLLAQLEGLTANFQSQRGCQPWLQCCRCFSMMQHGKQHLCGMFYNAVTAGEYLPKARISTATLILTSLNNQWDYL